MIDSIKEMEYITTCWDNSFVIIKQFCSSFFWCHVQLSYCTQEPKMCIFPQIPIIETNVFILTFANFVQEQSLSSVIFRQNTNRFHCQYFFIFIILAGTPPTIALSGISFVTTALAPTVTLFPIFTVPNILTPNPK